jgi:hypothetical protein
MWNQCIRFQKLVKSTNKNKSCKNVKIALSRDANETVTKIIPQSKHAT